MASMEKLSMWKDKTITLFTKGEKALFSLILLTFIKIITMNYNIKNFPVVQILSCPKLCRLSFWLCAQIEQLSLPSPPFPIIDKLIKVGNSCLNNDTTTKQHGTQFFKNMNTSYVGIRGELMFAYWNVQVRAPGMDSFFWNSCWR